MTYDENPMQSIDYSENPCIGFHYSSFLLILFFHISCYYAIISIYTLQLRVLDVVTSCLSTWSNPKLDLTIESHKTKHSSMVFVNVKHKSSSTSFFKSAMRISTHRTQDLLKLEQFLYLIENFEPW